MTTSPESLKVEYQYEIEPIPEKPPRPMNWRVVVRPLKPIEKTKGGIIVSAGGADLAQEYNTYIGQVVAVGDLAFQAKTSGGLSLSNDSNVPKVGSFVIYGKYSGQRIQAKDGSKFIILDDDSILCVVDDPNEYRVYL